MGEQEPLLELEQGPEDHDPCADDVALEDLKLRRPERRQRVFSEVDVEHLVGVDHPVRAIWELSGQLDLSEFAAQLRSRRETAGRSAWDPQLLVAIWIWAYSQGISSAREIERQCRYRPELQWLCGMEKVNHHTLSDFRVLHSEALELLFTRTLALLSQEGLVDLEQVAVDGTRIRSQGSSDARRRRKTLERHLNDAREVVRQLSEQGEQEGVTRRQRAARERAARERLERLRGALDELEKIEAAKDDEKERQQARASATEPESRPQRECLAPSPPPLIPHHFLDERGRGRLNGGFASGYNAQLATDAKNDIVVGIELTNNGSDQNQLEPTLADVEQRLGQAPRQALADEGYNSRANIAAMEEAGIEFATPAPAAGKGAKGAYRKAGIAEEFEPKFFIYDESSDTFRCPAKKTLSYRQTSHKRKNGPAYRVYQANRSDCMECEFRERCCPNSGQRMVSRSQEDDLMARHREWMGSERARAAYGKRSQTAEFPNAWVKERIGLRKFRVKGLKKARAELLWAILAYNVAVWTRLVWKVAPKRALAAA